MLAPALKRRSKAQELILPYSAGRYHVRHFRGSGGDSAGLVEHDGLDLAGSFHRDGGLKEYPVLCTHAVADHYRDRRRKAEGAGAADNEHGYAAREREADAPAEQQPHNECDDRDGYDCRDEHAGDLIGDLRYRRLGRGGFADHFDDLAESRVLADAQCAAADIAVLVHGRGGDLITLGLVDGDALAGQRRFIDRAAALDNNAVNGDALTRTHGKDIVLLEQLYRDLALGVALDDRGGLGRELHEPAQGVGRLALGARFKHLADGDERQDHGGGLKVEVHHIAHDGFLVPAHLSAGHGKERIGAVNKRGAGAERDERIHIRCAVHESLEAADEELLIDDHDDHRQQQLRQPHRDMVAVIELRQRPAPHHVPH